MSGEKIAEYIETMAANLGVAAEHVYGVLVQQAVVNGVRGVVGGALLLTLTYFICRTVSRVEEYDREDKIFGTVIFGVIPFVLGWFLMHMGVGQLINPEYYAIREILDVIGGGSQ